MWARRLIFKHKQLKPLMFIWSDCRLSGRFLSGQHRRAPWSSWPGRAGPYPWPLGSSSGQTSELSSGRGMYNNWSRWPGLRIAGSIISGLLVAPIMKTLRPLSGCFNSLRPFWYRSVDQKAPVLLATILAIKEFLWLTWSVFDTQDHFLHRGYDLRQPLRSVHLVRHLETSIWFGGYLKTRGSEKAFGGHLKTRII